MKYFIAIAAALLLAACSTTPLTDEQRAERQRRDPQCPPSSCRVYGPPEGTDRQNQQDELDEAARRQSSPY